MKRILLEVTTLLFALVIAAMLFISPLAQAAEFDGDRWSTSFNYFVDRDCPDYVAPAVKEALEKHSPVVYHYFGKSSMTPSNDSQNLIYCGATDVQSGMIQTIPFHLELKEEKVVNSGNAAAGRARWYVIKKQDRIVECDVWLSSIWMNEGNVDKYVLHEVTGHCMGLRHLPNPNAVMYFAPYRNDFHVDDFAELADLYDTCPDKDFIDSDGNIFHVALDVEALLARLDLREHDRYRGVELVGKQYVGSEWPAGLVDIRESGCDG